MVVVVVVLCWSWDVPALGLADRGGPTVRLGCVRGLRAQVRALLPMLLMRCMEVLLLALLLQLTCRLRHGPAHGSWPMR